MMKRQLFNNTIPLLAILLCPVAYGQTEQQCLGVAKFAEIAAELQRSGQPEKQVIADMLDSATSAPKRPKARQKMLDERDTSVINWVYTVRPSPADARAIVYLKCMAGGLGAIDMAKFKAASRGK